MRRLVLVALVLSLIAAFAGAAAAGAAEKFVKHQERYWTWFGPRDWTAASGAYGITISDARGLMGIDYGGSSILCDGPPKTHFKGVRRSIVSGVKRGRISNSRFQQSGGTFFNNFDLAGTGDNGKFRAEIRLAYSSYDGTYCYASGLTKAAPAKGFASSIKVLNKVTSSIAYFGPGLPINPGTGLP